MEQGKKLKNLRASRFTKLQQIVLEPTSPFITLFFRPKFWHRFCLGEEKLKNWRASRKLTQLGVNFKCEERPPLRAEAGILNR